MSTTHCTAPLLSSHFGMFCFLSWISAIHPAMSSAASTSSQSNRETGGDAEKRSKRDSRRANSSRTPKTVSPAAKRSEYQLSEHTWKNWETFGYEMIGIWMKKIAWKHAKMSSFEFSVCHKARVHLSSWNITLLTPRCFTLSFAC